MRICSNPLFITNTLKLATNGIFPDMANPAPTPTMFASAIPHEEKRSGNSDLHLLEPLVHHEHAEAGHKRDLPRHGQSRSHTYHVRLGDTAREKAVGEFLGEIRRHGGFRKIGVHYHHVLIFAPQFHQGPPEGLARGRAHLDFKFGFGRHGYFSSCRASFNSSWVGAVPWNLGLFSMNDTPFPLMVCATMQVGLPLVAAASASAPSIPAKSCPSISSVCHPNSRHFSATGAISMMSLTKPSSWIRL